MKTGPVHQLKYGYLKTEALQDILITKERIRGSERMLNSSEKYYKIESLSKSISLIEFFQNVFETPIS